MVSLAGHAGGPAGFGDHAPGALANLPGPDKGHVGLVGAHPFSTHPLAGGSGPRVGKGLMYAAALPGAGGSAPGTSLLTGLVGKPGTVADTSAGAGAAAAGGAAPVGALGAGGAQSGAVARTGMAAPALLTRDADDEPAPRVFDDEEEW